VDSFIFIGIGGFLGANARYLISTWITDRLDIVFPLGTLLVNFSGSLLLAVFIVWSAQRLGLPDHLRLMIGTGFFGAFTTFSTFANESVALFETGHIWAGLANILGSNVLCIVGAVLGLALAQRLFHL
jgi:CrcB protein